MKQLLLIAAVFCSSVCFCQDSLRIKRLTDSVMHYINIADKIRANKMEADSVVRYKIKLYIDSIKMYRHQRN